MRHVSTQQLMFMLDRYHGWNPELEQIVLLELQRRRVK